ncbi:type 1 glutamine amidotransferase [Phaeobacter sp. PT47_59]|uniref:type 1 glutamine amidotransferase n=1 Tax=Phaeobacter sp. PT47_59 TaxID=3029979 RepID=UPI00237FE6FA|nr:type 1 glutamine amidotransferase [Phaeobacter sp. PT47_59]MDE4174707.1 type 1 glutamine amidotransferase [Phaeobacter sp. PT47_59]
MHLAILMTNTDESDFAARHPKDGVKFADLIHMARPGWRVSVFSVKDGEFPADMAAFDGAMITGSPASVRDDLPWIPPLMQLIRDMHARKQPLFGACFGHQAVALALGGSLGDNPCGWVQGLTLNTLQNTPPWARELPSPLRLYGSHKECVTALPKDAVQTATSRDIIAGFIIGRHIWTTQHHPEMTHGFITALTKEMKGMLPDKVHAQAVDSLTQSSDQARFAEALARFFEQAGA